MENLWKSLDSANEGVDSPKEILENQAAFLNDAMNGLIEANVETIRLGNVVRNKFRDNKVACDFCYAFVLESDFVDDYVYRVIAITYGIKFYPLHITINDGIAEELENKFANELDGIRFENGKYLVKDEKSFIELLSYILNSEELMHVLRNLKNLAVEESEQGADFF